MQAFFSDIWNTVWLRRTLISLVVVLVAVVVWLIIRHAHRAYKAKSESGMGSASSLASVIFDTIKVAVVLLLVLVILQVNGVNVTSLVAGFGIAGGIIGLALQDFFKDIIMGIHVLMDSFFEIGELVQFDEFEGTVIAFNLRTTKIRSLSNGDILTVCNRNIDRITKSSTEVYIRVPLPYELTAARSKEVLDKICERAAQAESIESCRYLGTTDFVASSVQHLVRIDIDSPEHKLFTRRSVLLAVREVLEQEKIEIPFEQLDVHMK